jgi:GABA(A) receptor-associated protein
MKFKQQYTLEKRIEEKNRILENHPARVPVIIERCGASVPDLDKKKFLVPTELSIGQLAFIIRKRIALTPEKALFLFINGILPPSSGNLGDVYQLQKDPDDGFLYVQYSGESTFGTGAQKGFTGENGP